MGGRNARIQLVCAVMTIAIGVLIKLSANEWLSVIGAITLVLCLEAVNTAIERAVDLTTLDIHPLARDAKDIAAGAVLMACVGAVVIAGVIGIPRVVNLVRSLE